jgi:hypothetical protein
MTIKATASQAMGISTLILMQEANKAPSTAQARLNYKTTLILKSSIKKSHLWGTRKPQTNEEIS